MKLKAISEFQLSSSIGQMIAAQSSFPRRFSRHNTISYGGVKISDYNKSLKKKVEVKK